MANKLILLLSRCVTGILVLYITGVLISPPCSVHRLNQDYHLFSNERPFAKQRAAAVFDGAADTGPALNYAPGAQHHTACAGRRASAGFEKCCDKQGLYIATSRLIM